MARVGHDRVPFYPAIELVAGEKENAATLRRCVQPALRGNRFGATSGAVMSFSNANSDLERRLRCGDQVRSYSNKLVSDRRGPRWGRPPLGPMLWVARGGFRAVVRIVQWPFALAVAAMARSSKEGQYI